MPGFFHRRLSARSLSAVAGMARKAFGLRPTGDSRDDAGTMVERFEALEERRLLFSFTIANDNAFQVAPGVFQSPAISFAYTIPYSSTNEEIEDNDPEEVLVDFNGDDFNAGPVGTNSFLPSDGDPFLRVRRTFQNSTQDFRLVAEDPTDATVTDFMLDVNARAGDFWEFEMFPTANVNDAPLVLNEISWETGVGRSGDGEGMNSNAFRVSVFFDTELLDVFTGARLDALLGALAADPDDPTDEFLFRVTENDLLDADGNPQKFTRIRVDAAANEDLFIDNVQTILPPGNFAGLVESRIFGAQITLTGPVGTSVTVTDLFGRDMVATLRSVIPGNTEVPVIDSNDDGVPDYNDGIGQIIISGGNANTVVSLTGGTIEWNDDLTDGITFFEPGFGGFFEYSPVDSITGLYEDFEDAGFGYIWRTIDTEIDFGGLPPGPGSVIVGAPSGLVRPVNGTANDYLGSPGNGTLLDGFNDARFGVRVNGTIGAVNVHGVVHGTSTVAGSLGRWNVGYQTGSLSVEGDLGQFFSASEAGLWSIDEDFDQGNNAVQRDQFFRTDSQLVVGRAVREIAIAGRSLMDVTVVGDLASPDTRPARPIFEYTETETITPIDPAADNYDQAVIGLFQNSTFSTLTGDPGADRGQFDLVFFGTDLIRNDSLLAAEWIGSLGSSVRVTGDIGRADPNHADDGVDVYAFASDGVSPIKVELSDAAGLQIRLMDKDGRTLAAVQRNVIEDLQSSLFINYIPESAGAYFLVVQGTGVAAATDGANTASPYSFIVSGMQSTTLGSYRTGGNSGAFAQSAGELPIGTTQSINVVNGGLGLFRVGTGLVDAGGMEADPIAILNNRNEDETDDLLSLGGLSLEVNGNAGALLFGSDIQGFAGTPVTLRIAGNLGTFATGLSTLADGGFTGVEGDVLFASLDVGGAVGSFDIRGSIGVDEDMDGRPTSFGLAIAVGTNDTAASSNIGGIRVGGHVFVPGFTLTGPANTMVGSFFVSQDAGAEGDVVDSRTGFFGTSTLDPNVSINLGPGSDIRFTDFVKIDGVAEVDRTTELRGGTPVQFVDDGGARFTITVQGASSNDLVGQIRFLPISSSEGVAIAQIDNLDLSGGRRLQIRSLDNPGGAQSAPISIGRILISNADAQSTVEITGNVEIDVYRIDQIGGAAFSLIRNTTPGGDLVAVDVVGLDELDVQQGDVGRTQVPAFGPQEIGPFLGVQSGLGGAVLGALGVPEEAMSGLWNGIDYRPFNDLDSSAGYSDDLGSPLDPYLNGVVVRTGGVRLVRVSGALGDFILQDGAAELETVRIDSDGTAPLGRFDGLIGSVFANIIDDIDVGMGIISLEDDPFAKAGVFANDELRTFRATDAFIGGAISATNLDLANSGEIGENQGAQEVGGIDVIELTDSLISGARISNQSHDFFWVTVSADTDNERGTRGEINRIRGNNSDIFRSLIQTVRLFDAQLVDGFFDASVLIVTQDLDLFRAAGFRNTTVAGTDLEFQQASIQVQQNLGRVETFDLAGDFSDISIDVVGSVLGSISGRDFRRFDLDVDNEIASLIASGDVVASSIVVGAFESLAIAGSLRTSEMLVSGPLEVLTVGGEIFNTSIAVTGSEGRIDRITVTRDITGSIASSGPIGVIETTVGDLGGFISTSRPSATVGTLRAARDITASTDLAGGVSSLVAGRNIGSADKPGLIVVRGALIEANAAGQLHSDIVVGQGVQSFTLGAVSNLPGQSLVGRGTFSAAGRFEEVSIMGDFGGGIISYSGGIGSFTITNGSFLPGNSVSAFAGSIDSLVINAGNLYGDVFADHNIRVITVNASADGVFGDVGISPFLSASIASSDSLRNQLPPGLSPSTAVDGPRITAGWNIGIITVGGGSMYEAVIHAGRALGAVTVAQNIQGDGLTPRPATTIAARDSVFSVSAGGYIAGTAIIGGLRSFGADGLPGGTGANADTVNSGFVQMVNVGQSLFNNTIVAGMNAGPDGIYNTGDELTEIGVSFVGSVVASGDVMGTTVFSEVVPAAATAGGRVTVGGVGTSINDPDVATAFAGRELTAGTPLLFSTAAGSGNITFTGPGRVFFDDATSRVIFGAGSNFSTSIIVNSDSGVLTDFDVVSINNGSAGVIRVNASLLGDSDIVVDAFVLNLTAGFFNAGDIRVGQHTGPINLGPFRGGTLSAKNAAFVTIGGDLGDLSVADPDPDTIVPGSVPVIDIYSSGFFTVNGDTRAIFSAQRAVTSFDFGGSVDNSLIRAGDAIGTFRAVSVSETRISSGGFLSNFEVEQDVTDAQVLIGGDLGDDANFDTGVASEFNADQVRAGFNETVTIGGSLVRSDIVGGGLRGPDRFFGSGDDRLAAGRSTIGVITIGNQIVGSNRDTESFRILSSGSVGATTVSGAAPQLTGNARVETPDLVPVPIRVVDLRVEQVSQTSFARIQFDQPMDASSFLDALTISEIRSPNNTLIRLQPNEDYTLSYATDTNTLSVRFSRSITDSDLPLLTSNPAQGVYRFDLDQDLLRAKVVGAVLDGDGDGVVKPGDDYSQNDIVGDAGDKSAAASGTVTATGQTGSTGQVDLFGPINLNTVLDNNFQPDGLPDVNDRFVLRGTIGDHPDNDARFFDFRADVDVYTISLQAGQILQLEATKGSAFRTTVALLNPDGSGAALAGVTAFNVGLPGQIVGEDLNVDQDRNFLITQTGTFTLLVGNGAAAYDTPVIPDVPSGQNILGDYSIGLTVFDDGNSGFNAGTDSGNGENLPAAPSTQDFAGIDGAFATADDRNTINVGGYTFTLDAGLDGVRGTADDIVRGSNSSGDTATREGGVVTTRVRDAIGLPGATGIPSAIAPDVDVFHLNGNQPITQGTRVRVVVQLADFGADLGSRSAASNFQSFAENVQFAIFDTTTSTAIGDGLMLYSPSDFSPNGGDPGTIAQGDNVSYGYDSNGDFFLEFIVGGRLDGNSGNPKYSVYMQGAFNTDYALEVTTTPAFEPIVRRRQNIFIETQGGSVDWLEVGGQSTQLTAFSAASLGFAGETVDNIPLDTFFINQTVNRVQAIFDRAGLDVNISTDTRDFEFQPFSTIFLSSTVDPISSLTQRDVILVNGGEDVFGFGLSFGFSEHVDAGNADRTDEAVVFVPSLALLGYTPSQVGIDDLADSLTSSVTRRIGELLGLSLTSNVGGPSGSIDVLAADSVTVVPGESQFYNLVNTARSLSTGTDAAEDTTFFLGLQNAFALANFIVQDD